MGYLKIKFENLSVKFQNEILLDGAFFEAESKNITLLTGESGAGKTTFLDILSFYQITATIEYTKFQFLEFNIIQSNRDLNLTLQNRISYILQKPNFIKGMTVQKNLELVLRVKGLNKCIEERIEFVLNKVGLNNFQQCYPEDMSGGELQRLELARVILQNPQVILADEITSALDLNNKKLVMDILRELADSGKIIIMVTHDSFVENNSDCIYCIKDKKMYKTSKNKLHKNVLKSMDQSQFQCKKSPHFTAIDYIRMKKKKKRGKLFFRSVLFFFVCFFIMNLGCFYQVYQKNYYNRNFKHNIVFEKLKDTETQKNEFIDFSNKNSHLNFSLNDREVIKNIEGIREVEYVKRGSVLNYKINESDEKKQSRVSTFIPVVATTSLQIGELVVTPYIAETLNLNVGDTISLNMIFDETFIGDKGEEKYESYTENINLKVSEISMYNNVLGVDNQYAILIGSDSLSDNVKTMESPYLNVVCDDVTKISGVQNKVSELFPTTFNHYDNTAEILYENEILNIRIFQVIGLLLFIIILLYRAYKYIQLLKKRLYNEFFSLYLWGLNYKEILKINFFEIYNLTNYILFIFIIYLSKGNQLSFLSVNNLMLVIYSVFFLCELFVQYCIMKLFFKKGLLSKGKWKEN